MSTHLGQEARILRNQVGIFGENDGHLEEFERPILRPLAPHEVRDLGHHPFGTAVLGPEQVE